MNFEDAVSYMQNLLRFGEKYGNERFDSLLSRLGDPHKKFQALHIAGTKGKGSTTLLATSILREAGYRTGAYLSPYVYDLRERIQVDGEMIDAHSFARLVTEIRPHIEALNETEFGQTTEFELKTAIAFCYFAEQNVEYAVVEVGLGGRLDATNVLPSPLVSVITNIGYDHMEILGDTLEKIAAEKAGIIKENGLCVTGIDGGPALSTVQEICRQRNARLIEIKEGRDWSSQNNGSFSFKTPLRELSNVRLTMRGRFQHANAAVAVNAIDCANIPQIEDSVVRSGLEAAFAPGRLEVVRGFSPTVVLDAAHNELAGRVLAESLKSEFYADKRPLMLVLGFSRRHDPGELLPPLLDLKPAKIVVTEPSFRPRPAEDTVACLLNAGFENVETIANVPDALLTAIKSAQAQEDALIVVTGSFFTIGDLTPEVRNSLFLQV